MATTIIEPERIQPLNDAEPATGGKYVLYWMQQSQRAEHNPALEYAVQQANEHDQRLLVVFGLMDDYPEANLRHYRFMIEGLADVAQSLQARNIRFVVQHGHPADVALRHARDATLVVCDRSYLRHQKQWRQRVAREAGRRVVQVEGDVVVPVDVASSKAEFAARTIRPKIHKQMERFLVDLRTTPLGKDSTALHVPGEALDLSDPAALCDRLKLDTSVPPVSMLFPGGTRAAKRRLREFWQNRFADYSAHRNQPQTSDTTYMSMHLHFGQISPVWLVNEGRQHVSAKDENRVDFEEELIVRRELAQNYCNFQPRYDEFAALPDWARKTLAEHADDRREHVYSFADLDNARTHDPYWNASMREMRFTGYMHNYMRMYWGKKILEWSPSPEDAFKTALALNNRYFIDGRDANSYVGVAWVFGLHDRAWTERPVYGKIRYMAASGLERKCDIDAYVEKVNRLVEQVSA